MTDAKKDSRRPPARTWAELPKRCRGDILDEVRAMRDHARAEASRFGDLGRWPEEEHESCDAAHAFWAARAQEFSEALRLLIVKRDQHLAARRARQ